MLKILKCQRRLGLALSGGGFRASFYHIGVLARMAELGMLKHVESISTVSGGSIVGAAYYILLKNLLESKTDAEITDFDYVELIQKLEKHFLSAVQKNLRLQTFACICKNMRMALPNYSRSDAVGELYERYIYRPLMNTDGKRRIKMSDLLIQPKGEQQSFHPYRTDSNFRRKHKVPVLMINATSLNTGHNWYFTATSMGEILPRNTIFRDIDKRDRYRRMRYEQITSRKSYFLLGNAVAASAAVPGIFHPMAISNLYEDRRVQLVDGGIYDNQGIVSLLDPDYTCTDFIVSDASGQEAAMNHPKTWLSSVLKNSTLILMKRVREEMVNDLVRAQGDRVAYFHLTHGLSANKIGWLPEGKTEIETHATTSQFEVSEETQLALSRMRTDLDSFTDVEAGCLQADGYQMSYPELLKLKPYVSSSRLSGGWQFSQYLSGLKTGDPKILKQLEQGSHQFGKPYWYAWAAIIGAKQLSDCLMACIQLLGLLLRSIPFILTLGVIFCGVLNYLPELRFVVVTIWKMISDQIDFLIVGSAYGYGFIFLIDFFFTENQLIRLWNDWIWPIIIKLIPYSIFAIIAGILIKFYLCTIDRYFIKEMGK